jgi:hypothetical protein
MDAALPRSRLWPEKEGQDEFLEGEPFKLDPPHVGPSLLKHTGGNSSRADFAVCVKMLAHRSALLLLFLTGLGDHTSKAISFSRINCGKS